MKPQLSDTQRRVLTDLARDGWVIRRNTLDKFEVCPSNGYSGYGLAGVQFRALLHAGYLARVPSGKGTAYGISPAGRTALGSEAATTPTGAPSAAPHRRGETASAGGAGVQETLEWPA